MKRFYTGIVSWICFLWITMNHTSGCFFKCFRYVLTSSVAVKNQRVFNISDTFFFQHIPLREIPSASHSIPRKWFFLNTDSITLVRCTNPSNIQIYMISEHQAASGWAELNSSLRIFLSFWLRSESMVVWIYGFTQWVLIPGYSCVEKS